MQLFPFNGKKQDYQCIEMLFIIRRCGLYTEVASISTQTLALILVYNQVIWFFPHPKEEKSTNKTLNWIKNDKFDFADENRTYQRPIYAFSLKLWVQKT